MTTRKIPIDPQNQNPTIQTFNGILNSDHKLILIFEDLPKIHLWFTLEKMYYIRNQVMNGI